ncbi:MAG: transposase [Chloroflexi bacterium]|nr:transposase [Chloroflexota bacterium]
MLRTVLVKYLYDFSLRETEFHIRYNLLIKSFANYAVFEEEPDHTPFLGSRTISFFTIPTFSLIQSSNKLMMHFPTTVPVPKLSMLSPSMLMLQWNR